MCSVQNLVYTVWICLTLTWYNMGGGGGGGGECEVQMTRLLLWSLLSFLLLLPALNITGCNGWWWWLLLFYFYPYPHCYYLTHYQDVEVIFLGQINELQRLWSLCWYLNELANNLYSLVHCCLAGNVQCCVPIHILWVDLSRGRKYERFTDQKDFAVWLLFC